MGGSISRCKSSTNVPKTIDQCIKQAARTRPRPSSSTKSISTTSINSNSSNHVSRRPEHLAVNRSQLVENEQKLTPLDIKTSTQQQQQQVDSNSTEQSPVISSRTTHHHHTDLSDLSTGILVSIDNQSSKIGN